jgi:2-polyprenyl-3-methyl-5-hydroxy-6-metoxy-1,4-benzoquinol methylase
MRRKLLGEDSRSFPPCPICEAQVKPYYDHPDADIYECATCSHVFSDTRTIQQEEYGPEYYEIVHRNWFANPNRPLFEKIEEIARGRGANASVFDVGCGNGDLLKFLRARNPSMELIGVELSDLPKSEGIRFIKSDIFELNLDQKFDLVVTLAVIEHVGDVRAFVEKLARFLKPGGKLVAMTLNGDSLIYRIARFGKSSVWPAPFNRLYSHHHLHHYTRASLNELMKKSGLKICAHESHNFPLAAVDFPSKGAIADKMQLGGIALLFGLGSFFNIAFLQTIVCERE